MVHSFRVATKAVLYCNGEILILRKNSDASVGANDWDLPGGKLEIGEVPHDALEREIFEETKLEAKILKVIDVQNIFRDGTQIILIFFKAEVNSKGIELTEHSEFQWICPKKVINGDFPEWIKIPVKNSL